MDSERCAQACTEVAPSVASGRWTSGTSPCSTRFKTEIGWVRSSFVVPFPNDAARALPDDHLDWVYIDADHTDEFVKQDLELFFGKVKPGGYLLGDDYHDGGWLAGA
jgi:hypothetical protein